MGATASFISPLFSSSRVHIEFREKRQIETKTALTRVPPTSTEAEALHSFYLKMGQYEDAYIPSPSQQPERVWMSDTQIEKSQLMFPQNRNAHSKIFGGTHKENHKSAALTPTFLVPFHVGYLMRLAYELGFANATLFCRRPVRFLSLDKIAFAKPVSIGSILRLRSTIIHSTASEKYPAIVVSWLSFPVYSRLNPCPCSMFA